MGRDKSLFPYQKASSARLSGKAENIIRKCYEQVTGNSASGQSWTQLLQEMERQQILKPSTLGYMRFLKDKRNEEQHPDKRFTQEESERILLRIKDLLDELKT